MSCHRSERGQARSWRKLWPLVVLGFAGCSSVLGLDGDYFEDTSGGGSAGDGGTAGTGGHGGASGGGNGGTGGIGGIGGIGGSGDSGVPLGGPCTSSLDCITGECCTDDACRDTCMVPCTGIGDCPEPTTMGCEHGYCLFPCTVDSDCTQPDFVCHHTCTWCEKKASQGCN